MIVKVDAKIIIKNKIELSLLTAELRDIDLIRDDIIEKKSISDDGNLSFIFSLSETGELNPDLQLRIYKGGNEIWRSRINKDLHSLERSELTGQFEKSHISFGDIFL